MTDGVHKHPPGALPPHHSPAGSPLDEADQGHGHAAPPGIVHKVASGPKTVSHLGHDQVPGYPHGPPDGTQGTPPAPLHDGAGNVGKGQTKPGDGE